jgi:hypothetical protein
MLGPFDSVAKSGPNVVTCGLPETGTSAASPSALGGSQGACGLAAADPSRRMGDGLKPLTMQ